MPHDLPRFVDPCCKRTGLAERIERGKSPVRIAQEAVHYGGAIGGCAKLANDLSEVVNGLGLCLECARHIEPGEVSVGVEKAVGSRPVNKSPDNLPNVVAPRQAWSS